MKHQNYFCEEIVVFVRKRFLRAKFGRCFSSNRRSSRLRGPAFLPNGIRSRFPYLRNVVDWLPFRRTWAMPHFHQRRFLNQGVVHQINDIVVFQRATSLLWLWGSVWRDSGAKCIFSTIRKNSVRKWTGTENLTRGFFKGLLKGKSLLLDSWVNWLGRGESTDQLRIAVESLEFAESVISWSHIL
jgi:hypothetical protein